MRIFILEDDKNRITTFREILHKDHSLFFVTDVKTAIDVNESNGPFDVYFLDHDLGGKIYVDSDDENTGYQFAKYLAEKNTNARIYIHSMNMVGAEKMNEALPTSVRIPFYKLISSISSFYVQ